MSENQPTSTPMVDPTDDFESEMSQEEMEALYDQSLLNFKEGEVVTGTIVNVSEDYALVDIGYKSEGVVALDEFPSPSELTVGDTFDVYIDEPEDEEGMPVLSKIKADKIKNWTHIQKIYEDDGTIEGRIVRRVKGGLKVDIGIDAFMPASQLTWRPTSDLERYLGERMELKIIKLTKRRRNVVVSRRKLLEEQRAGEKQKLLSTIEIGQTIPGEVKNITDFGAFVDVGGIDGLLHVTDMSWGRVKHPSQVVSVAQKIDVMVLNFDPKTERISLGLKQKSDNPWKSAQTRYPVGGITHGKVVSMTDYGAFVQLEDGIEGMVHVSEMSWTRRVRHPNEVLNLDEDCDIMILSVDPEAEKIALGIKQTRPNPWSDLEQRYPVGSAVKGVVRNLTDYGAFIEIEEGIDALLHVSDLSWTKKVAHPSEVLERDQEVDVKILSIDPGNEKISVGLKQLDSDPWQEVVDAHPIGTIVEAEIAKLVSFGAFARLVNGIEGLIHVSELGEGVQRPEDVLNVGDTIKAKVINIDTNDRKIGLSIRELDRDSDAIAQAKYGSSGDGSTVSIGDVVGDAVPASLLQGTDIAAAANEMMADDAKETATAEAESSEPVAAEASEPVAAEASEPVAAEASEPVAAEASEPEAAEASEPVAAEASEPEAAEASEPVAAEASEPVAADDAAETPAEESDSAE